MHLTTLMPDLNDDSLYRFHLAKPNWDGDSPLDALAKSDDSWLGWQTYCGDKERFVTEYIVSFAQISGNRYLFGGIFRIISRNPTASPLDRYKVEYINKYTDLIGRLIIYFTGSNQRGTSFKPSYIFDNTTIHGIYESKYRGEKFVSFENINHSFDAIDVIVKNELADWKAALSSVFGIYLLTDIATGKHYIGSAYGEYGIWGRWVNYIYSFHGNNMDLLELFGEKGETYIKSNFKFTILEIIPPTKSSTEIIHKECLWKEKLMTRAFGFNKN